MTVRGEQLFVRQHVALFGQVDVIPLILLDRRIDQKHPTITQGQHLPSIFEILPSAHFSSSVVNVIQMHDTF